MMQIIEENRRPSTAERFAKGLSRLSESLGESLIEREKQKKQQRFAESLGINPDVFSLPSEAQRAYFSEAFKGEDPLLQEKKKKYEADIELAEARKKKTEGIDPLLEQKRNKLEAETDLAKARKESAGIAKGTLSERPMNPEQVSALKSAKEDPRWNEATLPEKKQIMTEHGVSNANSDSVIKAVEAQEKILQGKEDIQEKRIESSYKRHEDFIQDVTKRHQGFETEMKPRLLQMQKLATDDELISPTANVFLESLGIPLGVLDNPESELYSKLSQDLLKGLPDTYGNRILKVEVENFLKTIPTLSNSPAGRRMIASNMLKLGEMKSVYYKSMRNMQKKYLDENIPIPKDFQQRVFDQVEPEMNRINREFVKMSDITNVPPEHVPMFSPAGEVYFIPKEKVDKYIQNGGRRIW